MRHRKRTSVILFEEALYQDAANGIPFTDLLQTTEIAPGIKVGSGLKSFV